MSERSLYLAYMLRLWVSGQGDEGSWRASLEDAHTGEQRAFADLATLFCYLQEHTGILLRENSTATPEDSSS